MSRTEHYKQYNDDSKDELLELCINTLSEDDVCYILMEQMRRTKCYRQTFEYECDVDGSYWKGLIEQVEIPKY